MTFRPTPRRPRKSHSHCVLPYSQRSDASLSSRTKLGRMQSSWRAPRTIPFLFNYLGTSWANGNHISLSLSTTCVHFCSRRRVYPQCSILELTLLPIFTTLSHFRSCTYGSPFCNPFPFIFIQEWGVYPPAIQTWRHWDVPTFRRSVRPIAAKRLWCNNPQRHQISLRSGETSLLLPVSKTTRADIGNCPPTLPIASRAWVHRSKYWTAAGWPE